MKNIKKFDVQRLLGKKTTSISAVRRRQIVLERELKAEFDRKRKIKVASRKAMSRDIEALQRNLLQGCDGSAVKALRARHLELSRQKIEAPIVTPHKQRLFTGSVSATVTPPYDYWWQWADLYGDEHENVREDHARGMMNGDLFNGDRRGGGNGNVYLGIYFAPPTECGGWLTVYASPALQYEYWIQSFVEIAYTKGSIGFYIERYDLNGTFQDVVTDQRNQLWNLSGDAFHNHFDIDQKESSDGYPLSAQFWADARYSYMIAVRIYVENEGGGNHGLTASWAGCKLAVTLPSITWTLD